MFALYFGFRAASNHVLWKVAVNHALTAELTYGVSKVAGFDMCFEVAHVEANFAAILYKLAAYHNLFNSWFQHGFVYFHLDDVLAAKRALIWFLGLPSLETIFTENILAF